MKTRFLQHLRKQFPFLLEGKFLLACSGGVDSSVLLHLFNELGVHFSVAYCNFSLRKEAMEESQHIEKGCKALQLPFFTKKFETKTNAQENKISIQMAARELRYEWFEQLCNEENLDYIVTAHHFDDQLETYLINLGRGTGIEGLKGIPEQNGRVVRPFLPFRKLEIIDYAKKKNISWCEDHSNAKNDYLRNRLRNTVIPNLKESFPSFDASFSKTLYYSNLANVALEKVVSSWKSKHFKPQHHYVRVPISEVKKRVPLDYYLHALFSPYGFHVNDVKQLIEAETGKMISSNTHRLLKDRGSILLKEMETHSSLLEQYEWDLKADLEIPVKIKILSKNEIETHEYVQCFDKSKLQLPVTLRKWKNGDAFFPHKMVGKKKVSKLLKDKKISMFDKENCWVLCSGDKIVWVVGIRADKRFACNPNELNALPLLKQ